MNKTKAVVNSRISQELTVVVSKGVPTIPKDILDANSANGKDPLNALRAGFDNVDDESKDEYSMDTPNCRWRRGNTD